MQPSFNVSQSDLGTGTNTSTGTRNYVNSPSTSVPQQVGFSWGSGNQSGSGEFDNVPPQSSGQRWDAGHILGRQSGGIGNQNYGVFPQNPQINRGNSLGGSSTFNTWRGPEDQFRNAVNTSGTGAWSVTLRDRPRPIYGSDFDPNYNPDEDSDYEPG